MIWLNKWYDLTNVDLLTNSSNHKAMLPEYSKTIPQISVSKIFQGYFRNTVRLWKFFMESKSSKNCFVGYPVKFLILVASSLEIFIGSLLKQFFIESKELIVMLGSWKKFKISITLLSIHNIIVVIANLFRQVFNVLVCSAQRDIFVIACVFDIMKFHNMLR